MGRKRTQKEGARCSNSCAQEVVLEEQEANTRLWNSCEKRRRGTLRSGLSQVMERKTTKKDGAGCSNSCAEEVVLGEREANTRSPAKMAKNESGESTRGFGGIPETQLEDLPDECLVEILHRVQPTDSRPNNFMYKIGYVQHPLHCALVCKRWHALANAAVSALRIKSKEAIIKGLTERAASRFPHLTALEMPSVDDTTLLALANGTSCLQDLTMQSGLKSPARAVMAHALASWTSLTRLSLGNHLCAREYKDSEIALNAVAALPSLQSLAFSHMHGGDLLPVCMAVGRMTRLQALSLTCNQVPPACAGHFQEVLRELELKDYKGALLPDSLGAFRRLACFRVWRAHDLTALPESIGNFSRLRELELAVCGQLASLPSTLGQLKALKELSIRGCESLASLPLSIGSLSNLESLSLSDCLHSKKLPGTIEKLTVLRILYLDTEVELPLPESLTRRRSLMILGRGSGSKRWESLRLSCCRSI